MLKRNERVDNFNVPHSSIQFDMRSLVLQFFRSIFIRRLNTFTRYMRLRKSWLFGTECTRICGTVPNKKYFKISSTYEIFPIRSIFVKIFSFFLGIGYININWRLLNLSLMKIFLRILHIIFQNFYINFKIF